MKRIFKAFASAMAIMLAVTLIIPVAACGPQGDHVIRVTSMGGLALSDVTVTVYDGGNSIGSAVTNEDGEVYFNLQGNSLTARLTELPDGYKPEDSYKLDASKQVNQIAVTSSIITDKEKPSGKRYQLGDVIYDFTLPTAYNFEDATETTLAPRKNLKLSEVFENKLAVVLNFFYVDCSNCQYEMPALSEAYEEYRDKIGILGLDDQGDSDDRIATDFVIKYQVPFYMGVDTVGLIASMEPAITGYPTTYMVDRYGVICEKETGGVTDANQWKQWFERYTRDDYSQTITPDDNFVADKPGDFGVYFTAEGMSERINKTGSPVTFSGISADVDDSIWPWALSDDGKTVYATNKGHYATRAILNAEVYFPEDANSSGGSMVLAFDYTLSGIANLDYLYVAVDSDGGMGAQTLRDTGAKAKRTGYAYVSLEPGWHTISFVYYKYSLPEAASNIGLDDTAKIENLRFVTVENFVNNSEPLDFPYYAARGSASGGYENYEKVYYSNEDGFYHVSGRTSKQGDDPILYALLNEAAPFFPDVTHQATVASTYFTQSGQCVFQGTDYTDLLGSYISWATNSSVSNLAPVTPQLQKLLQDIYLDQYDKNPRDYAHPDDGWLELCTFFVHYGDGDSIGFDNQGGIEGLAAFTAFKAKETTGKTQLSDLNKATFDRIVMPRGFLYEFVPEATGVYKFSGANHLDDEGEPVVVGKDAWLFDGDDFNTQFGEGQLSYLRVAEINECGTDYIQRTDNTDTFDYDNINFNMFHYLEKGHKYYVLVAFNNTDNIGDLYFRIDRVNDSNGQIAQQHAYITSATGGFIIQASNSNKYYLPSYVNVKLKDGVYVADNALELPIYCDFTDTSRMFNRYSIATLLGKTGTTFKNKAFDFTKATDLYGNEITTLPDGKPFLKQDFTDVMVEYYEKSIEGKSKSDELYGLCEVDETLRTIIIQFYMVNVGFDNTEEWLKACYYFDYTSAAKPKPDTILYPRGVNAI